MMQPRSAEQRGAAAVEFALVLPLLLAVVFGTIQYGLYLWSLQGGSSAAKSAARTTAVGNPLSCSALRDQVIGTLGPVSTGNVTVTRSYEGGSPVAVGDQVTITVSFDGVDTGLPLIPVPSDGRIVQSAQARVEHVPDDSIGACP